MKFLLLCLAFLTAQAAAPEVEITAEPHHLLTFENNSVRVFNVELASHSDTLMHWHRHDYIYVTLGAIEVVNAVKDKPPVAVKFEDGDTRFSPATFAHIARNVDDHVFRNVTIEILEDESLRNSTAKWDEDRGLTALPNGTQQILFVKDAIRVSEFELNSGGVVPLCHHAGPQLLVAINDLDLRRDQEGQGINLKGSHGHADHMPVPTPDHFKSGDSRWIPGNDSYSIKNTGPKLAKFVTLEFP
jgi:hypothetical protein